MGPNPLTLPDFGMGPRIRMDLAMSNDTFKLMDR